MLYDQGLRTRTCILPSSNAMCDSFSPTRSFPVYRKCIPATTQAILMFASTQHDNISTHAGSAQVFKHNRSNLAKARNISNQTEDYCSQYKCNKQEITIANAPPTLYTPQTDLGLNHVYTKGMQRLGKQ